MIYTLTISPSLDYYLEVENFKEGIINRTKREYIIPGGKGINVSLVLNALNVITIPLGFIGGYTGKKLKELLFEKMIVPDFIETNVDTRINVKIKSQKETAINTNTSLLTDQDIEKLLNKIRKLTNKDILIIGGNIPKNNNQHLYELILEEIKDKKILTIIDTNNNLLIQTLKYQPYLIKPNKEEVEEIFNCKINSIDDAYKYAKILQEKGAENVVISLDKDGAIMLTKDQEKIYIPSNVSRIENTVGCGDSMVAGITYGLVNNKPLNECFKIGTACAMSCCESIHLPTKEQIFAYLKNLQ